MPVARKWFVVCAAVLCASFLIAQQLAPSPSYAGTYKLDEILSGKVMPLEMTPKDLPADYKAVVVTLAGNSDILNIFSAFSMGSQNDQMQTQEENAARRMAAFTKGEIAEVDGVRYYVAYGTFMSTSHGQPTDMLRLRLIRVDQATSIMPISQLRPAGSAGTEASVSHEATTQSLQRVKQASLAALMYSQDYDEVFPYVQRTESAVFVMYPYAKSKEVFQSAQPGGRLLYNMNIGGVLANSVESPATTPVWGEFLPKPDTPFAVGYVDGHAKLLGSVERPQFLEAWHKKFPRPKTSKPLPPNYGIGVVQR